MEMYMIRVDNFLASKYHIREKRMDPFNLKSEGDLNRGEIWMIGKLGKPDIKIGQIIPPNPNGKIYINWKLVEEVVDKELNKG